MKLALNVEPIPNGDKIELEFVPLLKGSLEQNDVEMPQRNVRNPSRLTSPTSACPRQKKAGTLDYLLECQQLLVDESNSSSRYLDNIPQKSFHMDVNKVQRMFTTTCAKSSSILFRVTAQ